MSLKGGNLKEADLVPGAFPSEDAIVDTERDTHNAQNATLPDPGSKATSGENIDEKSRQFLQQQEAAHTAGGQKTDKYTPGLVESGNRPAANQDNTVYDDAPARAGSGPGQSSEAARTDVSNPETLFTTNPGAERESTTGSSRGLDTAKPGQQNSNAQNAGHDESSITSDLATMATAVGLAAKDAFAAATDAAGPAATAATEQVKELAGYTQENAAPAANYAAEQAGNAAAYTRNTVTSGSSSDSRGTVPTDTALQSAGTAATYAKDAAYSAANTAQSYAPNVLGEPSGTDSTTRNDIIASEVPHSVQDSVSQAGKSPEAAANAQAVGDKAQMEQELLGRQSQTQEAKTPNVDVGSHVKGLEEQMAPDSMTPGVVTVLGTEQDRSFPLGAVDHSVPT